MMFMRSNAQEAHKMDAIKGLEKQLNCEIESRKRTEDIMLGLEQMVLNLRSRLEAAERRNPPSNVLKAIHTIQGREIVEAKDGSLWQRDGDVWKNVNLPDTAAQ